MNEMKEENDCFLCKRLCIFDLPSFAKENFNLLNSKDIYYYSPKQLYRI